MATTKLAYTVPPLVASEIRSVNGLNLMENEIEPEGSEWKLKSANLPTDWAVFSEFERILDA